MAVGDIYEVRHEGFSNENERWNQVWHWELVTDVGASFYETAEGLAEELAAGFAANMLPLMNVGWEFISTRCTRVWPGPGVPYSTGTGAAYGSVAGEGLPADIAVVVTKRTDQPTRRFLGRTYFGGVGEAENVNGQISVASAEAIADAFEAYRNLADPDGIGNNWLPCVFSRKSVEEAAPVVSATITRLQVDRILKNMRPRSFSGSTYVNPTN